jgi:Kef-type K+ transport system membrane component KefB
VALVIGLWLSRVRSDVALFALLICVVVSEVGQRIGLDTMVVMLTGGVALRNAAPHHSRALVEMLGKAALPVYLLFFSVAGATLHLDVLATLAIPAVILVGVRAASFWAACKIGGRLARSEAMVARWTWTGLLPQAGLALALALLIERSFPTFGQDAAALCFGVVAINELVMPIVLRIGLTASGETGTRADTAVTATAS